MKKITLIFSLPLCLILTGLLSGKDYTIDRISIDATILPDGNLQIRESRTYTFRGKFSWADYQLPLQRVGTVKYFSLKDEFGEYKPGKGNTPGSYYTELSQNRFYCRWYYAAKNETRTFTLSYIITQAVTKYQDIAEFYFKFVGEANSKTIGHVSVVIHLPEPADTASVNAFAHGPLWGNIRFSEGNLLMSVQKLPAHTFWEARVLFPPSWVPELQIRIQESKLKQILAEERAWGLAANERRRQARKIQKQKQEREAKAWPLTFIFSLSGILGIAFLYYRYGRSFQVPYHQKVDSEIPRDYPPAVVSTIYFNKHVYGSAMSATLFDLARRGYLTIEQTAPPEKKWWGTTKGRFALNLNKAHFHENKNQLLEFERDLIDFTFTELGQGNTSVDMKIFKKKSRTVQKWFKDWKKKVIAPIKDIVYYDKKSIKGTVFGVILSSVVIGAGVVIFLMLGRPGIVAIVCGSLCIGLSFAILRYTPEIKLKRKKYGALRSYLKKYYFTQEGHPGWLKNIQQLLVYAIALGAGSNAIKKMMESIPADHQTAVFPWYIYASGSASTPADFATAISSMVNVASSTVSSSTGAGGGASGGGGGGGGGAVGGAG